MNNIKLFFMIITMTLFSFSVLHSINALAIQPELELNDKLVNVRGMSNTEIQESLDCLATNIYHEAGNQSLKGKVAVAQVTLNRVNNERFPNTICEVVKQKARVKDKTVCQFSWYCVSRLRNKTKNNTVYEESYEVAKKVLLENYKLDVLEEALYFHADYTNPRWRLTKIIKIGNHVFYKG
jgi:N-acetylmuramoyl-L-alanine amidase